MKNESLQQEILLVTGSEFASREYSKRENTDNSINVSVIEKLKEVCWSGLLKELIPEIFPGPESAIKIYLLQVREANRFIALEMGEYPTGVDKYLSIDPYRFMEVQQFN